MLKAFKVPVSILPEALEDMNRTSDHFQPRVVQVIVEDSSCMVIVDMNTTYPFIENRWRKLDFN